MTDHFNTASRRAGACARQLLHRRFDPTVVADALIAKGLAVWAAATGREADAHMLVQTWTTVRDAR